MNDDTIHECEEHLAGFRKSRFKGLAKVYTATNFPRIERAYKKSSGKVREFLPKHLVDIFERKLREKP